MKQSVPRRRKLVSSSRRIRRIWPSGWYERQQQEFAAAMRESYARLRADPYAWREYMDELAAWDPVCVPRDYFECPEKYAPLPDTPPESAERSELPVPPTWVPVEWDSIDEPGEASDAPS